MSGPLYALDILDAYILLQCFVASSIDLSELGRLFDCLSLSRTATGVCLSWHLQNRRTIDQRE